MKYLNLDKLIEKIESDQSSIVLFGAGSLGKLTYYALKNKNIKVTYFCDNDLKKQGELFCGVEVISLEKLATFSNATNIIICNNYIVSTLPVLKELNFSNIFECVSILESTNFADMNLERNEDKNPKFRHKPLDIERLVGIHKSALKTESFDTSILDIKYIDIAITERCSMKCVDCSNLMQYYSEPIHNDTDLLLYSLDKIMENVDNVYELRIIGGEPFVNKEIGKIINKITSTYKNFNKVVIYTNATIVPRNENFTCMKHRKVSLDITNYGKKLSRNHDKLINLLDENSIPYISHRAFEWHDSGRIIFQDKNEKQLTKQFKDCCVGDVLTLLNGKLYRCPFSANAHNLHSIPDYADDVIDLNNEHQTSDFLRAEIQKLYTREERRQYLEACNYCRGRDFSTPEIPAAIQTKEVLPLPSLAN